MANRKGKLKAVGLLAVGFLTGAILVGGLVAWRYFQMFKEQYYTGILSNANTAFMIRAEREEELLRNLETNIRQCVASADSLWGNDEDRISAFWLVQRYYERFDLSVPKDIKPILDRLPPRPLTSCEQRQQQEEPEQQEVEHLAPPDPQ